MSTKDALAEIMGVIDELHIMLVHAGMELGVKRDGNIYPVRVREPPKLEGLTAYDKVVVESELGMTLIMEWSLRCFVRRLESKTSYSAEDMTTLSKGVYRLSMRVQYLSTLAMLRPAFETYYRHVRNNRNFGTSLEHAKRLRKILWAMAEHPSLCIHELAELYEIENIPVEAVDYFLEPDENGNDRSLWLRRELRKRGHYAGKRGRPRIRSKSTH